MVFLLAAIPISLAAVLISLNFFWSSEPEVNKAAIVDQGSLSPVGGPNPVFIETATNILEEAGYTVDYYPGEEVTVEFYKNLPTHNYDIIILRVHSSTVTALKGNEIAEAPICLFTSEDYSRTRYVKEQLSGQLAIARYFVPETLCYFGIKPAFVTISMNGKFQNTTVLMMGCEGLENNSMAEAFIEKGATAYISWSQSVSDNYADQATIYLLQHLLTGNQTIEQAVENTMEEIGPDPPYNSLLIYYPISSGNYTIEKPD
ncbi:MAG: hypothetical protein MUO61_04550 [Dehalococcoidia bacterium]|nr:hypothetical protein [Dehalococcoidia bacterium]